MSEVQGRTTNLNTGGSVRTELVTAYREGCLKLVAALDALGPQSPAQLARTGTGKKTGDMLRKNHYGWFVHLGHALWGLSERGRQAAKDYKELIRSWRSVP